jgi:endonuclease III
MTMKKEESEISAIVATMREMVAMPSLNSSEKLLGRILVRTVMSTSTPDCYSEEELEVLKDFAEKIEMEPEDIIRMAVSIMAEGLAKKLNDAGGDDIFTVCP